MLSSPSPTSVIVQGSVNTTVGDAVIADVDDLVAEIRQLVGITNTTSIHTIISPYTTDDYVSLKLRQCQSVWVEASNLANETVLNKAATLISILDTLGYLMTTTLSKQESKSFSLQDIFIHAMKVDPDDFQGYTASNANGVSSVSLPRQLRLQDGHPMDAVVVHIVHNAKDLFPVASINSSIASDTLISTSVFNSSGNVAQLADGSEIDVQFPVSGSPPEGAVAVCSYLDFDDQGDLG